MTPLVEVKWVFRRWYIFAFTAINTVGVGVIIAKVNDPSALKWIALGLISANMVMALLYIAGASGTDIARVVAAARSGAEPPDDPPQSETPPQDGNQQ